MLPVQIFVAVNKFLLFSRAESERKEPTMKGNKTCNRTKNVPLLQHNE